MFEAIVVAFLSLFGSNVAQVKTCVQMDSSVAQLQTCVWPHRCAKVG
jgi:hypothetical protein